MKTSIVQTMLGKAPHGQGTSDPRKNTHTTVGAASSAAVPLPTPQGEGQQIITMISNTACRLRFGDTTVGAATANDFLIPANVYVSFLCGKTDTNFRVIQDAAGGFIDWFDSSAAE